MDQEFEELRKEFLREASDKIAEIRKLCNSGFPDDEEDQKRVMNIAHQLKGAGGSYGYDEISSEAARMEESLEDEPDWSQAEKHLHNLERRVQEGLS